MIEQTAEEKALSESFHYLEVRDWAGDMIQGGLEMFVYNESLGVDKKPFWQAIFHSEGYGECIIIDKFKENGFETMNLVHDAFVKGRA